MSDLAIIALVAWLSLNVAFVALRLWVTRPGRRRVGPMGGQPSAVRVRAHPYRRA